MLIGQHSRSPWRQAAMECVSSCNTWRGGTGDGDSDMTAADIASEARPPRPLLTTSTAPSYPLRIHQYYTHNREKEPFTDKYNS